MSDRTYNTLRIVLFSFLAVFGGLTLLQYLAIPVHQSVLLSDAGRQAVAAACPSGGTLCLGWNAFFPFIQQTFVSSGPFVWFGIWSALAFIVLLLRTFLRDGTWRIRMHLRPVWLIAAFLALLWLHFTVIGAGNSDDGSFARLYEPTPQVYAGADAEQLQALQENFDLLKAHGCLTQVGTTQNGAGIFDMSALCMQASFFSRVLPQVLLIAVLLMQMLALGRFLLRKLTINTRHPLAEMAFSLGVGSAAITAILWLVAVMGAAVSQPIYNSTFGWGLMLLIPALLWRDVRYWMRSAWDRQFHYDEAWYAAMLPLVWLLLSLLALNFLNVVRPFPIGWDDLGRYLNVPRLLVSYGFFIPQLATFQWEYLTSLGFLLFGYDSTFAATASMMINWSAGLIAVFVVYTFGRLMMGPKHGVLAALLYYVLPMVGHFSFADMKVDNAVFLMGSLAVMALFFALFPMAGEEGGDETEEVQRTLDWRWLTLCGVLVGFAFGFKPTTVMTFFAIGTMLFGARVHWTAFVGTVALSWVVYMRDNRFNVVDIAQRVYGNPEALSKSVIMTSLLILGLGLMAYSAYLRPGAFRRAATGAGVIIGTFFLALAPWLLTNNIAYGNIIPRLVFTAPNNLTPIIAPGKEDEGGVVGAKQVVRTLPAELQVDMTQCTNTSKTEELDRYWGYGTGWGHYLRLPWRSVMNADSAGYYVTTYPALLLFPLLLLLPYFWRKEGKWLRWLFAGTMFMLLQWMFFANGILWYGIGTFFGLVIGLEALTLKSPDVPSKVLMSIFVGLSIMVGFSNRFWQFDQQKNLFEYSLGKISDAAMRERTIPYYDDIREAVEQRAIDTPDQPYVYRMGTFIPYFIPKNLEVIPIADQQLDFFNCLYVERNAALTLKRLQALGFNSMIFDTNTSTIERDQNGSLHQKVQLFVDFVNTPGLGLGVPINDTTAGIAYVLLPPPSAGSGATVLPTQQ